MSHKHTKAKLSSELFIYIPIHGVLYINMENWLLLILQTAKMWLEQL